MIDASQTAQIARMALNYCRLGATDAQLAEFFDVTPETLGDWMADSRDFAAGVRRGRKMADAEIVDSLHQLAMGYVETVEKVMVCRGEPMVVTYRKQHRPHHKSTMTWLCNRMPQDWQRPGTKREEKSVADAVDLFALPLLVDESLADEQDEAVPATAPPVVSTKAPLDFARDKLRAERRDLLSTVSSLSWREGPAAPLRSGSCMPQRVPVAA